MSRLPITLSSAVLSFVVSGITSAQVCTPQAFPHPLEPPAQGENSDFGRALAVSMDYAVVGAPLANDSKGEAYVYALASGQWQQVATLGVSGGISGDQFGSAVAIDGDRLFIGAPGANGKSTHDGAVFVYKRGVIFGIEAWLYETKLSASDGEAGDLFGAALAVDAGVLAVGVPRDSVPNKSKIGAVCIYERIGNVWTQLLKLQPSQALQWETFGASVAIDLPYLVVGSPNHGGPNPYPASNGRARIYERKSAANWVQDVLLDPAESLPNRMFGASATIVGTRVVVGATGAKDGNGTFTGGAYVYEKGFGALTWSYQAKLTNDSFDWDGGFGSSVALTLNQAWIAGAKRVLRFDYNGGSWVKQPEITAPFVGLESDSEKIALGPVLAAKGATVFVGRPGLSMFEDEFVFPMHSCGGEWNVIGEGTKGSMGKPRLRGAGPLQDDLPVEFRLVNGKGSAPAIFLLHGGAAPAGLPFAQGKLYAMPVNFSLVLPLSPTGTLTLPAIASPGLANVSFTAQVMIGDTFTVSDVVLSNGLEFTFGI